MNDDELLESPPVTAWSYSSLKQFEKCPYSIYLAKVAREPGPERDENHPLERGSRSHLEAERYVRGELDELPVSLVKLEHDFIELRDEFAAGHVKIEEEWGFDILWNTVDWSADDVWCRMKLDVQLWNDETTLTIIDHKTGKSWGNEVPHTAQGQTYAVGAFHRYPQLVTAAVQMWYLDEGKKGKLTQYSRHDAAHFAQRLTDRALKLTTATHFFPKPSKYACQYCDYGNSKGTGACGFAAA
jgi:RecB family exonuclease